jgi:hypothetical protein
MAPLRFTRDPDWLDHAIVAVPHLAKTQSNGVIRAMRRIAKFAAPPDPVFQTRVTISGQTIPPAGTSDHNGERAGTRTQDLLINLPPRFSPPPFTGFVVWTFPSPYPNSGT